MGLLFINCDKLFLGAVVVVVILVDYFSDDTSSIPVEVKSSFYSTSLFEENKIKVNIGWVCLYLNSSQSLVELGIRHCQFCGYF